jgi:sugar/nucleoside kinase (ribokinase family)
MNPPRVLFLGRTTLDATYRLDRLPGEDTKVYATHFHAAPGGPALNAAITHSLLGGRSLFISAVGGGPWSIPVRAALERHHISLLDLAVNTAYETPLTTVLVNSANASRTIVNPPISTLPLPPLPATIELSLPADWAPLPHILLTDGFHLVETLPYLAACRNAGSALCLDGGSWKPGTEQLAPLLTAAICSERFTVPGHADHNALFDWFSSRGVPCIALTRGPRPILCWERGRRFQIDIAQINAVDTLGAGDVLHGAFAHCFASGLDFEPALRRAAQIATLSCQSTGAESWAEQALVVASDPGLQQETQ